MWEWFILQSLESRDGSISIILIIAPEVWTMPTPNGFAASTKDQLSIFSSDFRYCRCIVTGRALGRSISQSQTPASVIRTRLTGCTGWCLCCLSSTIVANSIRNFGAYRDPGWGNFKKLVHVVNMAYIGKRECTKPIRHCHPGGVYGRGALVLWLASTFALTV